MTTEEALEFTTKIRAANQALSDAKTADDVRAAWKEHYLFLGHRALGRLLVGGDVEAIIAKKEGA
jgi:hypothetical protein